MHRPVAPGIGLVIVAVTAAGLGVAAQPATGGRSTTAVTTTSTESAGDRAMVSRRIIGYSVNDRPIRAYRLGSPRADTTVVAVAAMHGNEQGGITILHALRQGDPIRGVDLWIVPRDNPDGVLRDRRHNARGVDLNRNFPTRWKPLTGWYYSGPRHSSEPETRALKRFLDRVEPDHVVSFHSPLRGIDASGAKDRPFARRLASELNLPIKEFDCDGKCHGTLTQWFNRNFAGSCVTVELASAHTWRYLHVRAPRGLVRAVGGAFVRAG